ncbi:MAG TPA: hypothetical protein VJ773_09135, partial [Gemmatimonadales bacterium]|nr:hypothetical protein [Gemmatimonadales bacterium]
MFIEVTDLLRCPADHAEAYLVLLPEAMDGREVTAGRLGCPVCHAEYAVREGVAELGPPPAVQAGTPRLDGGGVAALLGVEGPGGYVALVGGAAVDWPAAAALLEGVHLVAVNPPGGIGPAPGLSVVR